MHSALTSHGPIHIIPLASELGHGPSAPSPAPHSKGALNKYLLNGFVHLKLLYQTLNIDNQLSAVV